MCLMVDASDGWSGTVTKSWSTTMFLFEEIITGSSAQCRYSAYKSGTFVDIVGNKGFPLFP